MTAKYGSATAPRAGTRIHQPGVMKHAPIQIMRSPIADAYLIMRERRSSSGEVGRLVMALEGGFDTPKY